jgi:hypothetical protein
MALIAWQVSDHEFRSVTALSPSQRYDYFIKRVAALGEVWGLSRDNRWAYACNTEGRQLVPVWPHARFAAASAVAEWEGYEARSIELDAWLERWIPAMSGDGRVPVVFPGAVEPGISRAPLELGRDLLAELGRLK